MELDELGDNLQIVVDKEENDIRISGSTFFYKETKTEEIDYPNAEMLIELFGSLGNNHFLQFFFISALKTRITNSDETSWANGRGEDHYIGSSALCFYALVQLGYASDAVAALKERKKPCRYVYLLLIHILGKVYLDNSQLREIAEIIRQDPHNSNIELGVRTRIAETRFQSIKEKISKINIEINQDKKSVTDKINYLGLSGNYNELLEYIDNFILADTSKVVNAGMISTLRSFMADLLKDIANRIAQQEGSKIPHTEGRGEMGDIRGYLKSKLEFSGADDNFIDSFIDILHIEGGHSFMSEKEYFRLSKNIAIEIALFVLSKYEKKYKK